MPTPQPVAVDWECLANGVDGDSDGYSFSARLVLRNVSQAPIAPGWQLYFNTCRKVFPDSVSPGFAIAHVNGDLFCLSASDDAPWQPGQVLDVRYRARFWAISRTDAPLGFYLVTREGSAVDLGDPHIVPFTRPEQLARCPDDTVAPSDAARRFEENSALRLLPPGEVGRVTPRPLAARFTLGRCRVGADTPLLYDAALENEGALLRSVLASLPPAPAAARILLDIGPLAAPLDASAEAYALTIDAEEVRLRGASAHGVFNGLQTLRQLLDEEGSLPQGEVQDAPRFAYRGMMLDVARHFASVDTVLRLLDCMALYKLNRFHLHLTDDEGWRLAIDALPELTDVGARRGVAEEGDSCLPPSFGSGARIAGSAGSGHYTHAEFIAILHHAHARHIEVIPEFNLPGHARAAICAMRVRQARLLAAGVAADCRLDDPDDTSAYESVQLWHDNVVCIALPAVDRFIDTVVAQVCALYREARVPLRAIHLGGDEVPQGAWLGSPRCRARMEEQGWRDVAELRADFVARCRAILARHGVTHAGWDESALLQPGARPDPRFAGPGFQVYVWNDVPGSNQEDCALRLARAGYEVVLASAAHLYFDLAHAKDPEEPGYYWAGFIDTRQVFAFCPPDSPGILGLQGQLWAENASTPARVEYLAAPRLLALAERAWSPDPCWQAVDDPHARARRIDADWNEFANRLGQRALPQLDRTLAYGYRLPPPGAIVRDGLVHANVSLPGLVLRHAFDGEPDAASPRHTGPLPVPAHAVIVTVASFDTRGRRSRVVTLALKDDVHAQP